MDEPEIAYFDTGVFVTPMLKNRSRTVVDQCVEWQRSIEEGRVRAYTSYLTWDEICYLVQRSVSREDASVVGQDFLSLPNLEFVPVESEVMKIAQMILGKWLVRPRDAIHASSSLMAAGGTIVTLDVNKSDYQRLVREDGTPLLDIHEIV